MKKKRKTDRKLLDAIKIRPCVICSRGPCDPSHIKSRGSGGPDETWNVLPMCRGHHTEWHRVGVLTFLKKYPALHLRLTDMGWFFVGDGDRPRLWHPELVDNETSEP